MVDASFKKRISGCISKKNDQKTFGPLTSPRLRLPATEGRQWWHSVPLKRVRSSVRTLSVTHTLTNDTKLTLSFMNHSIFSHVLESVLGATSHDAGRRRDC